MSQVTATIAGRQFRLACEDGQEEHLNALAQSLDQRIVDLRAKFGEIGDTRLTVMAALVIADELTEAQRRIRVLEDDIAGLQDARQIAADRAKAALERRGSRLQLGGRAHRGAHPQAQPERWPTATAWRSAKRDCLCEATTISLPLPLEGEGGECGAIASTSRERGLHSRVRLPLSRPSLGYASARAPSPQGERGEECRWQRSPIAPTLAWRGCEVRRSYIPRGLTILTGAVPGRDRGFGHMAPTYLCRFPGSYSGGHRGSALLFRRFDVTLRCERPKVASLEGRRPGAGEVCRHPSRLAARAARASG